MSVCGKGCFWQALDPSPLFPILNDGTWVAYFNVAVSATIPLPGCRELLPMHAKGGTFEEMVGRAKFVTVDEKNTHHVIKWQGALNQWMKASTVCCHNN
jgi:hypothetical protein